MDEMSPHEMDEMMELAAEHDPEHHRELLRDDLESVAWDAREGHLTDGDTFEIIEWHGFSPDPMDDDDFEWEIEWLDGGGVFRLHAPDGQTRGTLDPFEEMFSEMGEAAQEWHLERVIDKYQSEIDPDPGIRCLPRGKLEILENETVEVYDPGRDVYDTVELSEVTPELVGEAVDDWRDRMEEKYDHLEVDN